MSCLSPSARARGVGKRLGLQGQGVAVTVNNDWFVASDSDGNPISYTGSGFISEIWFAMQAASAATNFRVRLKIDGNYVEGAAGVTLRQFIGALQTTAAFRTKRFGCTSQASGLFGGYLRHRFGYERSFQLEFKGPTTGTPKYWVMLKHFPYRTSPNKGTPTRICNDGMTALSPSRTWTTIASQAAGNSGHFDFIQFSMALGSGVSSDYRLRISYDGVADPQYGGIPGLPLPMFFKTHNVGIMVAPTPIILRNYGVIDQNFSSSGKFVAYLEDYFPFSDGWKIELYGPTTGTPTYNINVNTYNDDVSALVAMAVPGMDNNRLFAAHTKSLDVPWMKQIELFSNDEQTTLRSMVFNLINRAQQDSGAQLEGDIRISNFSESTAIDRSSGTEDFFFGISYFGEEQTGFFTDAYSLNALDFSLFLPDLAVITAILNPEDDELPAYLSGVKFTWANGDAGLPADDADPEAVFTFFSESYVRRHQAPAMPTTLAGANGTPTATKVRLTWDANREHDLEGYKVYRDGTLVTTVYAATYDDTPGNTSTHSYTVKAFNFDGETSAASVAATAHATA
jgi:hypothetical protein